MNKLAVTSILERDSAPRSLEIPEDLAVALQSHAAAASAFAKLSYSHQKEYVDWIISAKKEETRARRIAQTVERVVAKRPVK
jgi:uncharacterized protein YdeI (YjbR/CyaY-like superfamily)